jgi:hypothetical protein
MNCNLQASKSLLAKLLAAENITVSHQNTKTAYFDLKSRTLVCPVWKDMDGHLYDLLMGHEVGHALNTPAQGWHSSTHDENGKPLGKFKDFLNVIEDARIEKQVKRKFPGLAKSFVAAYKDLYENDFFGIKDIDANKLNLIDRINLRYKMGAHLLISFNDDERVFLNDIDNAETWDHVVDVARRVYAYCKQQKEEEKSQINNMDDLREKIQEQREQEQSEFQDFNDKEEFDDDSDDLNEESDGSDAKDSDFSEETDDESKSESESETGRGSARESSADESNDEPESVTDRSFRQREQELINATGEVYMIELPEANLSKIILQNNVVMNDLEKFIRNQIADPERRYGRHKISYETVAAKCVHKFSANNKKFIMHILKEFEMRKKASDYARMQTTKTGELNLNVLHKYKFTNDLFKKISVVPKGKNHGMIMYVDMSGSMSEILRNTIEQCLVLVSFCRLAKIPFDVYGFSNDWYQSSGPQVYDCSEKFMQSTVNECRFGHIDGNAFHLKHLIGSALSLRDYRRSFANLCIVVNEYTYSTYRDDYTNADHGGFYNNWEEGGFGLNGTPFQHTLLASRDMINKFRAKHKLDIVNVIYLTDGIGQNGIIMPLAYPYGVIYLVDKKTKKKIRVNGNAVNINGNVQTALTQLVREVTGCKHLGFFLTNKTDLNRLCRELAWSRKMSLHEICELKKQFRDEKFFAMSNLGYDQYFYIQSAKGAITEDKMEINSSMTKSKMANEFSKSVNSKKSSRALVTQFAEEISASLKWAA